MIPELTLGDVTIKVETEADKYCINHKPIKYESESQTRPIILLSGADCVENAMLLIDANLCVLYFWWFGLLACEPVLACVPDPFETKANQLVFSDRPFPSKL